MQKHAHENEKKYHRATCLYVFPKWAKNAHKKEKNVLIGPHASVHFENGPNAKNG